MKTLFYHTPFVSEEVEINGEKIKREKTIKLKKTVKTTVKNEAGENVMFVDDKQYIFHVPEFPRITFCGLPALDDDGKFKLLIGVSMISPLTPNEQFCRKKGRSISLHRAKKEPLAYVYCDEKESIPVFHHLCKLLEPEIRATWTTWSDDPKAFELKIEDILSETSAE